MHDGKSIWWDKNGNKIFEGEFVKGVPQGGVYWRREDGYKKYEGIWENGKLDKATTWDTNNQINGEVENGGGTLIFLHPNGATKLEAEYKDGELDKTKWFDDNGNELQSADPKQFKPVIPRIP